jgi:hypothetical protein
MTEQKTHRERKSPRISVRDLADYMAASEIAARRIARNAKYQPIGRIVQHDEARAIAAKFIRDNEIDTSWLNEEATRLRERLADSPFERDLYDHNADYIDRLAAVWPHVLFPSAMRLAPGPTPAITLNGVRVTMDLHVRLQRLTKTNKVRTGGVMLRYAKGKALPPDNGAWQSAFLFEYLMRTGIDPDVSPEHKLCVTFDVFKGECHLAPTNSKNRFRNMEAACASIAEQWPNIKAPSGAIT